MEKVRVVWTKTIKSAITLLKDSLLLRMLSFLLVAGLMFYGWAAYEEAEAQEHIRNMKNNFTTSEKFLAEGKMSKTVKDVPGLALAKNTKALLDPFDQSRVISSRSASTKGSAKKTVLGNKMAGKQGSVRNGAGGNGGVNGQLVDTNQNAGQQPVDSSPELKGIVHSVNGAGAIIEINGKQQTLLLGETKGTVTLLALGENTATLSVEEEEQSLRMKE